MTGECLVVMLLLKGTVTITYVRRLNFTTVMYSVELDEDVFSYSRGNNIGSINSVLKWDASGISEDNQDFFFLL